MIEERTGWMDVFPGLMFSFCKHIGRLGDTDFAFNDRKSVWTVIAIENVGNVSTRNCSYLLLGPGPIVKWHRGELGWINRIVDQVREERHKSEQRKARAAHLANQLLDTAMALSA